MRKWLLIAALAVSLPAAIVAASDLMSVKLREAAVRAGPKHFKPVVATLKYGDQVEVLSNKDGWLEVRLPDGRRGFLHESATTDKPLPKLPAGAEGTQASGVSREEVALAGKGFNPQVERQYRTDHRELEAGFAKVDAMERRWVSAAELDMFLTEGKLGEAGRHQ